MSCALKLLLDEICRLLNTYKGRDKILRTLCYTTKLIGGLHSNAATAHKFLLFSKHMSATRTTSRLLDDVLMLKYNLEYGLGHAEPDRFMATLGLTTNLIDQIFYPIEKMAWLAEHKFIDDVNASKWDTASSVCWVLSIYLTLMKSLRYVSVLRKRRHCLELKSDADGVLLEKLITSKQYELLTCVRLTMDFVHAVNTLPKGYLWAAKLNTWQVGLVATASSLLGLYQIYAKK